MSTDSYFLPGPDTDKQILESWERANEETREAAKIKAEQILAEHNKFMDELYSFTPELKAMAGCCEEASTMSRRFYIPCNQPATRMVQFRGGATAGGEGPYRMCDSCSWHNVRNRGAEDIGAFAPEKPE